MDIRISDPGGFLEHVPDAVAVVDRQWRCVYFNAAFQRMIGQDREHLLGMSCWELASAALGNTFEDQFRRAMAQQVPVKFETLYPRLGIWVETRVFPLPQTLTIFFRDITDRQKADQALRASEAQYRDFFDLATVGMSEGNPASRQFMRVNQKLCDITGYQREELLAMTEKDIIHPDDLEADRQKFQAMLAGPAVSYSNSHRYVREDGTVIWVEVNATAARDQHGCPIRTAAVITDITKRKHVEDALRNSEQRFHSLFERNPDGVFALDTAGRIALANPACSTIFGYSLDELVGRRFIELCAPDQRNATIRKFQRTMAGKPPENLHTALICKDGKRVELLITGGPVTVDGKVVAIHCAAKNITDAKRTEEALRKAKEHAEAASGAKDQFIAVLSHELRTPLTPVLPTLQMMETDPSLTAESRESLAMIRRNVELEIRLIDDLLDLTRISRGKLALHLVPVDLHDIQQRVIQLCQSDIHSKSLKLNVEWNAKQHFVRGDAGRLQQVLWNLLKNAVKFTPVGGRITFRTENPAKHRVAVIVSDTGVGIKAALLPHIFNAFEQGEYARQFGGLGLGLAISKQIAQLLGGTLSAQSEGKDQGATFTLELTTCAEVKTSLPQPALFETLAPKNKGRILLVEDHSDTARTMDRLLRSFGYEVRIADSVASGLQYAAAETFDLLISDIGLPDGSGLDLMRQLQLKRPLKGIALSGYGMEEDISRSHEAGFSAHLTKPVDMAVLRKACKEICG